MSGNMNIKQIIPQLVKNGIRTVIYPGFVVWARMGFASHLLARMIRPKSPPLLIISIPRSGSSWVGEVMGLAKNAMYLREPINLTYMKNHPDGRSFFEVQPNNPPREYQTASKTAFYGLPDFPPGIVYDTSQWSLASRSGKHVVIKEINPLALEWMISSYHPRIVFLVRHPAAVANSFQKMGWMGKQFDERFTPSTLRSLDFDYQQYSRSFWTEFGAMQAHTIHLALETLARGGEHMTIKYEDLCMDPMRIFRDLYNFAGLQWGSTVEDQIIARSEDKDQHPTGRGGVFRLSSAMVNKWKDEMDSNNLEELKEAYLSFNPQYYQSDEW
jgi:hypothetical protein